MLVMLPVLWAMTAGNAAGGTDEAAGARETAGFREIFREAFHDRTYRLLICGFSTCGFHMVLIEAHLFSQFVSYGIEEAAAAWAFSVYGITTIAGALLSGWLSTRIATLIGFLFLCHQIGAFLSAWLGGLCVTLTGGYTLVWCMDIAVCTFASLASLRIR